MNFFFFSFFLSLIDFSLPNDCNESSDISLTMPLSEVKQTIVTDHDILYVTFLHLFYFHILFPIDQF